MILNFSLQLSQDTESIITNYMERKIYTPNILISKGQMPTGEVSLTYIRRGRSTKPGSGMCSVRKVFLVVVRAMRLTCP